jgi:hypothetical protein
MNQIAINPETGEAVQWDGGKWASLPTARNPETGEVRALVGGEWQAIGAGTPPDRGTGEKVQRGVSLFGRGMNDAVGATAAAPVEAMNWLMKQPAKLLPEGVRNMLPDLPQGGFYTEKAQGALNALAPDIRPENTAERVAYGAGQGVGNAASVMMPAAAVSGLARAGSMPQAIGAALSAQPVMQAAAGATGGAVTEATGNPVYGLGAALAVPAGVSLARGLISPGGGNVNPETRRLVDVAGQEGIPLTAGQATGSRPMRAAESVFSTLPTTAGRQEGVMRMQREAFNRAVLGRAGVRGENLATPDVLQAARDRIGGELGAIANRNTMTVNADVMQRVQQVAQDATRYLPRDVAQPVRNRIADFIDKIDTQNFTVSGQAYARLDSAISRQIREASDGGVRGALQTLRDALREGMDASISGADAEAWQAARRQYANLAMITRAMNSPNAATAAGNVPPAALSQALASGPQRNFAMGRGEMNDLTRVGRAFIQDAVPNSGTPERNYMINLLTGGAVGGGALAAGGSPGAAALTTAATLAGPRVAQEMYLAPAVQAYLRNQLADQLINPVQAGTLQGISAAQAKALLDREMKEQRSAP